ncbi:MAG: hypothetical protein QF719_04440 [Chloroflexota bacterium]|jgi:hypothetical protein|nr:hypothetical protein [Chloroflexota bacterium]MDP6509392.1 hypothetical protein [Chloroflexota bacterium]MDP6757446.1 hypothetical protein [Chloroflexota bacterium]
MNATDTEFPGGPAIPTRLDIYVADGCTTCAESARLAAVAADSCPEIDVRAVHLSESGAEAPDVVVAVPTFVLNDAMVSLGNPDEGWLLAELKEASSTK